MAILQITPQNYAEFITPTGISYDPRQYLAPQTLAFLQNRTGLHRGGALGMIRSMRAIADALDPSKPNASKMLPEPAFDIFLRTSEEVAGEITRLRTMADYFETILDEFLPDPEPVRD